MTQAAPSRQQQIVWQSHTASPAAGTAAAEMAAAMAQAVERLTALGGQQVGWGQVHWLSGPRKSQKG